MRDAIFFQPLPCCSRPWRKRRCSSAVQRPVFSPPLDPPEAGVAVIAVAMVTAGGIGFFDLEEQEEGGALGTEQGLGVGADGSGGGVWASPCRCCCCCGGCCDEAVGVEDSACRIVGTGAVEATEATAGLGTPGEGAAIGGEGIGGEGMLQAGTAGWWWVGRESAMGRGGCCCCGGRPAVVGVGGLRMWSGTSDRGG